MGNVSIRFACNFNSQGQNLDPGPNESDAVMLAGGHGANGSMAHGWQSDGESNNSTFGEVISVKIPVDKGCGFVQFANRKSADDAIQNLNGTVIGKNTVRLSWGRTPNKQDLKKTAEWGHLKDLHKAIKLCEPALVFREPTRMPLGNYQEAHVYKSKYGACSALMSRSQWSD